MRLSNSYYNEYKTNKFQNNNNHMQPTFQKNIVKGLAQKISLLTSSIGLASFGMAQVNMNNDKNNLEKEYKTIKKEIKKNEDFSKNEKFELINTINEIQSDDLFTQYSCPLIKKIINNQKIYRNKNIVESLYYLAEQTQDEQTLYAKLLILNKYSSHNALYNNRLINLEISSLIENVDNVETADIVNKILDQFILANKKNESNCSHLGSFIYKIKTPEDAKIKLDIISKYFNDNNLNQNTTIQNNIDNILKEAENNYQAQIIDIVFSNQDLRTNDNIINKIKLILLSLSNKNKFNGIKDILNKYIGTEEIKNNKSMQQNIGNILSRTYSQQESEYKIKIIDKFTNSKALKQNPTLSENIGEIISNIHNEYQYKFVNKIFENEILYQNENIIANLANIIDYIETAENFNFKNTLVDKYISNKMLYENDNLQEYIDLIIENLHDKIKLKNILDIIDTYIDDPNLNQNKEISKYIGKIIYCCDNGNFQLAKKMLNIETLDKSKISTVLSQTRKNNSDIDLKKVQNISTLLTNSKYSEFVIKSINNNHHIDIILFLTNLQHLDARDKLINPKYSEEINPLLSRYLPIINELPEADVATKFKSKLKNQIKTLIEHLSEENIQMLEAKGINIQSVYKKLNFKISKQSDKIPQKVKIKSGFRSKNNITGVERNIIDKYRLNVQIWRSEEETKKWAEKMLNSIIQKKYYSNYQRSIYPQRQNMLQQWFQFINTNSELKNNTFAKLIIADFITENLSSETATLPPILDKDIALQALEEFEKDINNSSFGNLYTKLLKNKTVDLLEGEEVNIDGIKGTWYTIPQTNITSTDFSSNIKKINTLAYGTNWCIRGNIAENYITEGNMHFFIDSNGISQICIREKGTKTIKEIQQNQQDNHLPTPYIKIIKEFIDNKKLRVDEDMKKEIIQKSAEKEKFENLKSALERKIPNIELNIFNHMLIEVNKLADGTYMISHYKPMVDNININAYGINENILLSNVSVIQGVADFNDSNVTELPKLKKSGGTLFYKNSKIVSIPKLEEINGKKL